MTTITLDGSHATPDRNTDAEPAPITPASRRSLWAGRVVSGLAALFMLFDAGMKVLELPMAVEGTTRLGYPAGVLFGLGVVQVLCLVVYLIPRTAVLGAILWTGYLGGAIATHVRVGSPLFSHTLFPIYVAAFLWAGLWLRDPRVRAILSPAAPPPRGGPRAVDFRPLDR
jgi:hypothetical protein